MIVRWLHDVRDHKYSNSISHEELENFILTISLDYLQIICKMIDNISWSKEASDIVSDVDRLEALGKIGIERCEIFTREYGGLVPVNVITHCHENSRSIITS